MVEVLVVRLGGVGFKGLVSGSIGIIPVEVDHSVALISRENKDVGVGAEGAKG